MYTPWKCVQCDEPLREGQIYYDFADGPPECVCEDCIKDYVEDHKNRYFKYGGADRHEDI